LLIGIATAALLAASVPGALVEAVGPQAQPRQGRDSGQADDRAEPRERAEPRQAQPRPRDQAPAQPAPRRRAEPPPRVAPPAYHVPPRRYFFVPVSVQRGYYYHPYFGFYYGPYYGPFYPFPGPYVGPSRYTVSAVRTRIKPVETEVYVNGYYAGLVDDFDGLFQRLYLPAGEHELEFRLEGYRTYVQKLYIAPGDTRQIAHEMVPLRPGEVDPVEVSPRVLPEAFTTDVSPPAGERLASPYGILTIRVQPADAEILVDGEAWLTAEGQTDLVLHVPSGPHQLEVRRDGYQPFRTEIELSEGAATRLNVILPPAP